MEFLTSNRETLGLYFLFDVAGVYLEQNFTVPLDIIFRKTLTPAVGRRKWQNDKYVTQAMVQIYLDSGLL